MKATVRQLRTIQIVCIAWILILIWLSLNFLKPDVRPNFFQQYYWLIVVLAAWAAIAGFTVQRSIRRRKPPRNSTPLRQWKLGHVIRFVTASSVGIDALLLYFVGAPFTAVIVLYALSLLLLAIWSPGDAPVSQV